MSKRKTSEADFIQSRSSAELAAPSAAVVVPRAWLVTLLVLVIAPWLVYLALWWFSSGPSQPARVDTAGGAATEGGAAARARKVGPWGALDLTPIVISPPLDYVPQNWGPVEPPLWHFPPSTNAAFQGFLTSSGLTTYQINRMHEGARPDPATGGITVSVDPAIIRELSPQARANLYHELEKDPRNATHHEQYRFFGTSVDEWLPPTLISAETRALVEPLVYRREGFLYFADIDLIRAQIREPAELQRLAKGLLRQSTLLVKLRVDRWSDVDTIAEYWGRGGRRTDIRPLLESVAGGGTDQRIDISHLLPALARQYLYRYVKFTAADLDRPLLANCFWTALNFFNAEPDSRYLDLDYSLKRLREDFYFVQDNFQLGDIVAFSDGQGAIFHVAVYLADGLVFGKNGSLPLDPWSILPIERLKGHYSQYAGEWRVSYHRRKDF